MNKTQQAERILYRLTQIQHEVTGLIDEQQELLQELKAENEENPPSWPAERIETNLHFY